MGQLVDGRIVNEAAQSGEASSVRDHGDNAPFLGCCEDGIFLNCFFFFPLTIAGSFGAHGLIVNMGFFRFHCMSGPDSTESPLIRYKGTVCKVAFRLSQLINCTIAKPVNPTTRILQVQTSSSCKYQCLLCTYSMSVSDEELAKKKKSKVCWRSWVRPPVKWFHWGLNPGHPHY